MLIDAPAASSIFLPETTLQMVQYALESARLDFSR
jgi:hypothetical protein